MRRSLQFRAAALLVTAALVGTAGCAAARAPEAPGPVHHVVLFWLNTPGDPDALAKLTEASLSFRSIPGVVDVTVGKALPSDRPVVDSTFDLGVIITFSGPGALGRYLENPEHQRAVAAVVKPLVKRMQVYDIVVLMP